MYFDLNNDTELNGLLDFVHDATFQLEDIVFEETQKTVLLCVERKEYVRFEPRKVLGFKNPWIYQLKKMKLSFLNVDSLSVDDQAHIGMGDICDFELFPSEIVLRGAVPIKLFMKTSDFRVVLERD